MKKTGKILLTLVLTFVMLLSTGIATMAKTAEEEWLEGAKKWMENCFNVNTVGGGGDWDASAFLSYEGGGDFSPSYAGWRYFGHVVLTHDSDDNEHIEIDVAVERYYDVAGEATDEFRISGVQEITSVLDSLTYKKNAKNDYTITIRWFHENDFFGPLNKDGGEVIDTSYEAVRYLNVVFTAPDPEPEPTPEPDPGTVVTPVVGPIKPRITPAPIVRKTPVVSPIVEIGPALP